MRIRSRKTSFKQKRGGDQGATPGECCCICCNRWYCEWSDPWSFPEERAVSRSGCLSETMLQNSLVLRRACVLFDGCTQAGYDVENSPLFRGRALRMMEQQPWKDSNTENFRRSPFNFPSSFPFHSPLTTLNPEP